MGAEWRTLRVIPIAMTAGGLVLVLVLGLGNGCAGTGPDALPEDESAIQVVKGTYQERPAGGDEAQVVAVRPVTSPATSASAPAVPAATVPAATDPSAPPSDPLPAETVVPAPRPALAPLTESAFSQLKLSGRRGGTMAYEIEGTVDEVAAMLLDMDGANQHRPWAQSYRTLSREGDVLRAEWHFAGKMGVAPKVQVELRRENRTDGSTRIRFKLVKKAFGIAAFFGDYVIEPLPGVAGRSRLAVRTFIDSGLPFVNATYQDIESGMREDAQSMRSWMEQRVAPRR
jgi:hypothetical protein